MSTATPTPTMIPNPTSVATVAPSDAYTLFVLTDPARPDVESQTTLVELGKVSKTLRRNINIVPVQQLQQIPANVLPFPCLFKKGSQETPLRGDRLREYISVLQVKSICKCGRILEECTCAREVVEDGVKSVLDDITDRFSFKHWHLTWPKSGYQAAEQAIASLAPTAAPTQKPTMAPTPKPTMAPTPKPTPKPTAKPTPKPTSAPTVPPTVAPTPSATPAPAATKQDVEIKIVSKARKHRFQW